jgi:hypothetical protein
VPSSQATAPGDRLGPRGGPAVDSDVTEQANAAGVGVAEAYAARIEDMDCAGNG